MSLEFLHTLFREDAVESHAYRVHLDHKQGILFLATRKKVHENLVFGNTARHKLPVTTENIAPVGFHGDTVALLSRRHLFPIVFLGGHDIGSLAHHRETDDGQHHRNDEISRHHLVILELAHIFFPPLPLRYINYIWRLVGRLQQAVVVFL